MKGTPVRARPDSKNHWFHPQGQLRIRLETEAKLVLQQKVREGACELLWSSILDYENARNPFDERLLKSLPCMNLAELADAANRCSSEECS